MLHHDQENALRAAVCQCRSPGFKPAVQAASFPQGPITITVPYPPGSAADTTARLVAQGMAKELQTSIIVENRSGASGAIGTAAGARAKADGHHLTLIASPAVMTMLQMKQPGFDLDHDFAPIGAINEFFNTLVVNSKLGIADFEQFKQYVQKHPGTFNFATAGNATPSDYAGPSIVQKAWAEHGRSSPTRAPRQPMLSIVSGESDGAIMVAGRAIPHLLSGEFHRVGRHGRAAAQGPAPGSTQQSQRRGYHHQRVDRIGSPQKYVRRSH